MLCGKTLLAQEGKLWDTCFITYASEYPITRHDKPAPGWSMCVGAACYANVEDMIHMIHSIYPGETCHANFCHVHLFRIPFRHIIRSRHQLDNGWCTNGSLSRQS